jgi:hypothetical protein
VRARFKRDCPRQRSNAAAPLEGDNAGDAYPPMRCEKMPFARVFAAN